MNIRIGPKATKLWLALQSPEDTELEGGFRSGVLDQRRIHKVKTDENPRVFQHRVEGDAENTYVDIVLDMSGSMWDPYSSSGKRKIEDGAKAALLIAHLVEVSGNVSAIHGFTTDSMERFQEIVIKDRQRTVRSLPTNAIQRICSIGCGSTPTLDALNSAAGRLHQSQEARKIMILLTDGSPTEPVDLYFQAHQGDVESDYYKTMNQHGRMHREDVIKAVDLRAQQIMGEGVEVVVVGLGLCFNYNIPTVEVTADIESTMIEELTKIILKGKKKLA